MGLTIWALGVRKYLRYALIVSSSSHSSARRVRILKRRIIEPWIQLYSVRSKIESNSMTDLAVLSSNSSRFVSFASNCARPSADLVFKFWSICVWSRASTSIVDDSLGGTTAPCTRPCTHLCSPYFCASLKSRHVSAPPWIIPTLCIHWLTCISLLLCTLQFLHWSSQLHPSHGFFVLPCFAFLVDHIYSDIPRSTPSSTLSFL